jgi:hypothetical protein
MTIAGWRIGRGKALDAQIGLLQTISQGLRRSARLPEGMERMRLAAIAASILVAAVVLVGVVSSLHSLTPVPYCPLEFQVQPLNTTSGWFYVVEDMARSPRPLSAYNVTFFTYSNASPDQTRIIEYRGPLTGLVGASGGLSFVDGGGQPGYLDGSGDYFWAATWHGLEVEHTGTVVGGTLACG